MIFFFVLSEAHTVSRTMVANSKDRKDRNKRTRQSQMKRQKKNAFHTNVLHFLRVHYNESIAKFLGAYKQLTRHICPAPAQTAASPAQTAALQEASVACTASKTINQVLDSTTDNRRLQTHPLSCNQYCNGGGRVCPNEQHLLESQCLTCGAATRRIKKAQLTLLKAIFGPTPMMFGREINTTFEQAEVAKTMTIDTCGHCNPLESENLWCSDIVWEYQTTDPNLLAVTWKDREDHKKEVTLLATSQEKAKIHWALSNCCSRRVCLTAWEYYRFCGYCFTHK